MPATPSKLDLAVREALKLTIDSTGLECDVNNRFEGVIKRVTEPDESSLFVIDQSYLKGFSPKLVVATNKRIVIINPSFWFRYAGINLISKTKVDDIHYVNIVSVSMERGIMLLSVKIKKYIGGDTEETEVSGLSLNKARMLNGFLEKILQMLQE